MLKSVPFDPEWGLPSPVDPLPEITLPVTPTPGNPLPPSPISPEIPGMEDEHCCKASANGLGYAMLDSDWQVAVKWVVTGTELPAPLPPFHVPMPPVSYPGWQDHDSGFVRMGRLGGKACRKMFRCKQACRFHCETGGHPEGPVWYAEWSEQWVYGRVGGGPAPDWKCHVRESDLQCTCQ